MENYYTCMYPTNFLEYMLPKVSEICGKCLFSPMSSYVEKVISK